MPRIEPILAGWEAPMQPLCNAIHPTRQFFFHSFLEWNCLTLPFLITCISAYRSVGFTIHVTSKNEPLYLLTRNDWKQISSAPTWLSSDLPSEQLPVSCQPCKKKKKQMSVALPGWMCHLPFNHSSRTNFARVSPEWWWHEPKSHFFNQMKRSGHTQFTEIYCHV